jgi:hypothetical protein
MELVGIPLSVLCFAASVAVVIVFEHGRRSRVERQMSSRVPLSDEAFGATYFPASWTKAASRIRRIVGEELDIDISRALTSDRFVSEAHYASGPRRSQSYWREWGFSCSIGTANGWFVIELVNPIHRPWQQRGPHDPWIDSAP